jgi:hypothetical protein
MKRIAFGILVLLLSATVLQTVRPNTVTPVHTQNPEVFKSLHDNVIIPEIGER